VPSLQVIEALDVIEHVGSCLVAGGYVRRAVRSVLSEEKKLSIAALSHTLPDRLMLQVTPWSASRRWNGSLVQDQCSTIGRISALQSTAA
jgi:hypothetical protein